MLSDMWSAITPRDVIVPAFAALGGWLAALRMTRSNEKIENQRRDDAIRSQFHDAKLARDDDLTERFRLLMNAYEATIAELKAEVRELRDRVEECERKWRMRDAATHPATD